MPVNADTQIDCESKCTGNEGCSAYVFNKFYKKCFLKSSVGTLFEEEVAYTGYKSDAGDAPRISAIKFRKNSGFIGMFYKNLDNARYMDCYVDCDKDHFCAAFNFDFGGKQCTMFRSVNTSIPMRAVSSGMKVTFD
jgi:hypothetical protein